jgi:cytochrome b involved in lipid metabolism
MTVDQFNKRVKGKKESLVILDDMILDVTEYMDEHPGGSFLL